MKRIRKRVLALLCATTMMFGCFTGCGKSGDTGEVTDVKADSVQADDVSEEGFGALLMESEIIRVYAKDNVLTIDCNNDSGISDFSIRVLDEDDYTDIFYHDAYDGNPSKDLFYFCELPKDGVYQMNFSAYAEGKEFTDFYSVSFDLKENQVDTGSLINYEAEESDLPKLTLYGVSTEDTLAIDEEDVDVEEDYGNMLAFTVDNTIVPLEGSYKDLKTTFADYDMVFNDNTNGESCSDFDDIDETKVYTNFTIDIMKDNNSILQIDNNFWEGTVNEIESFHYIINDVSSSDFSIDIRGIITINKDTAKEDILDALDNAGWGSMEYVIDWGDKIDINCSPFVGDSYDRAIQITFENGKIKSIGM